MKTKLLNTQQLKEGIPFGVNINELDLVVFKQAGEIFIYEGRCPHQGALLSGGEIEQGYLLCPAHKWAFNCQTGEKKGASATCLYQFEPIIEQDELYIEQAALTAFKKDRQQISNNEPAKQPLPKHVKQLKGPRAFPLLGNLPQIKLDKFHQKLEAWAEEYGPVFRIKMGPKRVVVVSDSDLIVKILKNRPEGFRRFHKMQEVAKELHANGVFMAEGDDWKRQRIFAMQALSNRHLRQFFPQVIEVTKTLKRRWIKAAQANTHVDFAADMMRYTVDITTRLAFGYEMNTLEEEEVIQQHIDRIFPKMHKRIFAPIPYWRFFKMPSDRKLDKSVKVLQKTIHQYIDAAKQRIHEQPERAEKPQNLLEALLVARDEDGSSFSEAEIYANVFTMLVAGEDTTANSTAWATFLLLENPEVLERLRDELQLVLGNQSEMQSMEQCNQIPYLDAVVMEAMRLKPVVPINLSDANKDVELEGMLIPEGTMVITLHRFEAMKEQFFESAKEFQPARWLDEQGKFKRATHPAVMPFGYGPRLCPGRSIALLQIKMVLTMLVLNFDLKRVDVGKEVEEHQSFTMSIENMVVQFKQGNSTARV